MTRTLFKVELSLSAPEYGDTVDTDIRWFVEDALRKAISEMDGDDEQPKLEGEVEVQVWGTIGEKR